MNLSIYAYLSRPIYLSIHPSIHRPTYQHTCKVNIVSESFFHLPLALFLQNSSTDESFVFHINNISVILRYVEQCIPLQHKLPFVSLNPLNSQIFYKGHDLSVLQGSNNPPSHTNTAVSFNVN